MLTSINQDLLDLKEQLREYNKLITLEKSRSQDLEKKKTLRIELKEILAKEQKDIEKLEKLSLSSVFSTLMGNKYEKLDKENEEYLLAKLKYEESAKQIEKLEKELKEVRSTLKKFEDLDRRYQLLIKEKEEVIISQGGALGFSLKESLVKIDEMKIDTKEIREAIHAGEATLNALDEVRSKLETAKGWGTWDLLGGGIIADIAKHSAIDKANKVAEDVQEHLNRFKKELSDVNEFTDIQVNLSSFASFADFFLDGIFADWFVQSKINNSLDNVYNTMQKIEEIINDLQRNLLNIEIRLKQEEKEAQKILEG